MRSAGLSEARGCDWLGTVHGRQSAARRCILDDACDVSQEGRAEAAEWPACFEVESLVELDTVIFVENDPAGEIEAGAAAFDVADRQKQPIGKRSLRRDGEEENGANSGTSGVRTTTQTGRDLRPLSPPASACRFRR